MSHSHRSSRALETELAHPPWAGNPTIGLATPRPFRSPHLPSPATSPARPKIKTPRSASHLPSIVRRGHDSFLFSLSHGIQGKSRDPKFSGLFICSHGTEAVHHDLRSDSTLSCRAKQGGSHYVQLWVHPEMVSSLPWDTGWSSRCPGTRANRK